MTHDSPAEAAARRGQRRRRARAEETARVKSPAVRVLRLARTHGGRTGQHASARAQSAGEQSGRSGEQCPRVRARNLHARRGASSPNADSRTRRTVRGETRALGAPKIVAARGCSLNRSNEQRPILHHTFVSCPIVGLTAGLRAQYHASLLLLDSAANFCIFCVSRIAEKKCVPYCREEAVATVQIRCYFCGSGSLQANTQHLTPCFSRRDLARAPRRISQ
jgi:hypothetical protein